jgi:SAM-dependent methyltransferase
MSSNYTVLAPIYDRLGLSQFAGMMASGLLTVAQQNDWVGKRILDLGCGTGTLAGWFAKNSYTVTGIDIDSAMIDQFRQSYAQYSHIRAIQGDIRHLPNDLPMMDMAFAIDTMNLMGNLREIESVLQSVSAILSPSKYFIFDLHTISGLTNSGLTGDNLIYNMADLTVLGQNMYDFERQTYTLNYHIFTAGEGNQWKREGTTIHYRAYPIQAVASLARRHQFEIVTLLDTQLREVNINQVDVPRVIFLLQKL